METVITQGIQLLLPYQNIHRIAFQILWNYHQNPAKVDSLQLLSLKTIMKKKMKKSDRPAKVFYRVLFKEEQDINKFTDRYPPRKKWKKNVSKIFYSIHDFFTGYPKTHKIYQELRKNPHLMLAVLEQNSNEWVGSSLDFLIKRNCLEIRVDTNYLVAEITHANGIQYDTHWMDIFARMAFSNRVYCVSLTIQGDENDSNIFEYLYDHLNNWIDRGASTIPEEGWKNAIENGTKPIYRTSPPWVETYEKTFYKNFINVRSFYSRHQYWCYRA